MSEEIKREELEAAETESVQAATEAPVPEPENNGVEEPAKKKTRKQKKAEEPAPASKIEVAGDAAETRAEVMRDARKRRKEREEANAERSAFLLGWDAMNTAMKRKSIIKGVVSHVEEHKNPDNGESTFMLAVILEGRYKGLVPFAEIYQENPIDMRTVDVSTAKGKADLLKRIRAMCEKLLLLTIPLIITDMSIDTNAQFDGDYPYVILASRRMALGILENQNYNEDRPGGAQIHEGDTVMAQITSVGIYGIAVVVGGVDTRIPMYNLTYTPLMDARTAYNVGEEIPVHVNRIQKGDDGHYSVSVDAKRPELEKAKKRHKLLPVGSVVMGIITSVRPVKRPGRPAGSLNIIAYIRSHDCPAIVRDMPANMLGREPKFGDELLLSVKGYTPGGFVITDCRGFHGAPGYLNHT